MRLGFPFAIGKISLGTAYNILPCSTKMAACKNSMGDKFTMAGITLGTVGSVGVAGSFSLPVFVRTV